MVKISVVIASITLLSASVASATTILSTNFDGYTTGHKFTDNETIVAGSSSGLGLVARSASPNATLDVVGAGEDKALQFTDNNTASGSYDQGPSLVHTFQGIPSTSATDSHITISFKLTYLLDQTGLAGNAKPAMQIYLNNTGTGVSNYTAFNMYVTTGGAISCQIGNTASSYTSAALARNTEYTVTIDLDMATSKWNILVQNGSTTFFQNLQPMDTRASMTGFSANTFIMNGGSHSGNANSSPYLQVDDLTITSSAPASVPEPAAMSLLSLGAIALLVRKSTR